ncbi:MAG: DUF4203 domain-containing protein, partial [Clostridia bacterium]|nr:DUF4203 domain-containing protein [Clostridia bacterium]
MLQTVLLIAALVIMIGVGLWMAFFAYRNTSILAVLLGFMLSIGGVIYFAVQFEWGLTSLPVLIGSPLLALITAIVGAMVLPAGNVVGGALMGFLYGYNLMAAVDILLSGAIPAFLFTGSCVLITLVCVVFCLVRHEDGPVLSSSFIGSFLMVYGVGAILTCFISGVSSAGGNMFAQFAVISSSMSGLVRLIIVIVSIILSIITMRVQSNSLEEDLDYDEEDDLWDEDEKDDEEDEDAPVLSKREQRRLEREARRAAKYADEDEDEDSFEDDEEDAPVLSKREQRRLDREARRAANYADEDEDEDSFEDDEED